MRIRSLGATAAMAAALVFGGLMAASTPAAAQGSGYAQMSCGELWYARNLIYANRGYCFETQRAIRTFGPRCYPPFGRLNNAEQRRVAEIRRWERHRGCR
ncbi:MAG: YARHG domain-containing protein [Pararhodobacter sp.]|nr:YARHG domain-containing protein [Pararhodobacter sp.]